MLIRVLAAVLLASVPLYATVSTASACSCANYDAAQMLELADAAFVGQVVSTYETEDPAAHDRMPAFGFTHVFEVEAVALGEFERRTEVRAPHMPGSCMLPAVVAGGARIGVLVNLNENGINESHLCFIVGADELLEVAGDSVRPPLPVSLTDQTPPTIENELAPAPQSEEATEPNDSGIGLGPRVLLAGVIAAIVGYAAWRLFIRKTESA